MLKRTGMAWMLGFMVLAQPAFSAVNSVAGLANPLDNVAGSARALAMGSAFVGVADDSSALLWNPAGLGGLRHVELALHHNSWLAGILQETAVAALPMGLLGTFGASVNYINYGTFAGYDNFGNKSPDYSANRYGVGLGWGKEVLPGFSAGLAAKGSLQSIAGSSNSGFAVDLGALWVPVKNLRIGASYSNLGSTLAGYAVASALRLGASLGLDLARSNQLLLAVSGTMEPQGVNHLQVGAEDILFSMLALRVGYQASLADNQVEGLTGLSAGAGFMFQGLSLDYAYLPFGDLGTTQRLSLSYQFGEASKAAEPSANAQ